jgi:hypothetical protein
MTNWKDISLDFNEQQLQKEWETRGFDYHQTYDWINVGLQPQDYNFANYLQNSCSHTPESILNEGSLERLRREYQEEMETQEAISRTLIESETKAFLENFEETQFQEALSQSLLISQTKKSGGEWSGAERQSAEQEQDSQLQATLLASSQPDQQVEKLKKEIISLRNQLFYKEIIEEKKQELEKQVQVLTAKNSSLQEELKKVYQQNEDLKKQLRSFQSERNSLKRSELEKLIRNIKSKLDDEELVDDYLEAQKEVNQSNNSFAQRQLEKIKQKLLKKISEEEIEKLCQLYCELLELEEKIEVTEAKIEIY